MQLSLLSTKISREDNIIMYLLSWILLVSSIFIFDSVSNNRASALIPAFFNNKKKPNNLGPDLKKLAPRLYGQELNYRVAVGDKENPFQLQGLHVELSEKRRVSKRSSTGIHEVTLKQNPIFVNEEGEQRVMLEDGGWEVSWGPTSPHGILTCSFVSPESVQRNKEATSTLEAGRFFIYHRVWTKDTLESERERRRGIQSEAAKCIDERDKKIKTITDQEEAVGSKVISYAQAARTMNDYRSLGIEEAKFVPLYDDQVLTLEPENCILSTRGQIFKLSPNRRRPEYIGESRVDFLKTADKVW